MGRWRSRRDLRSRISDVVKSRVGGGDSQSSDGLPKLRPHPLTLHRAPQRACMATAKPLDDAVTVVDVPARQPGSGTSQLFEAYGAYLARRRRRQLRRRVPSNPFLVVDSDKHRARRSFIHDDDANGRVYGQVARSVGGGNYPAPPRRKPTSHL